MREQSLLPRGRAENAAFSGPGSRAAKIPGDVRRAFVLWLVAVGAGVLETIVRVGDSLYAGSGGGDLVPGILVRVVVYSAVLYVVARMRLGRRWARNVLAVLLGGIGTLSLVVDPISWLAAGNSPLTIVAEADLLFGLVAPLRIVHLAAVLAALVSMFRPAANHYFRAAP